MREDPMMISGANVDGDDNVVALPNLMSGRLADLLAAASGAGQEHELRGELSARTAFQAASAQWPTPRRKLRRTPAVVAVTTVATMMVATTGLAAATELPGSAGRAVQGIFGTVGVNLTSPSPSGSGVDSAAGSGSGAPVAAGNHSVGVTRGGCTVGGTAASGVAVVGASACAITVPRQGSASVSSGTSSGGASRTSNRAAAAPAPARTFHAPQTRLHSAGGTSTVQGPSAPVGGGTSRGGNSGGSGSCGTTTTTTSTTSTTDPATDSSTTTTTTDPSDPTSGCGHTGHHHGSTTTTTTTTP